MKMTKELDGKKLKSQLILLYVISNYFSTSRRNIIHVCWICLIQEKTRVLFAKDTEINPAVILKKLHEILGARGKKGTDRTDQIEYLKDLRKISEKHNLGV